MKVLVTDDFTASSLARLNGDFEVTLSTHRQPPREQLMETEVLLIRSRTHVNKKLLSSAPRLRYVVTATSGFDHIDYLACKERGIKVAYTPEANVASAAEHTFALLLSLMRKVLEGDRRVRRQEWKDSLGKSLNLQDLQLGLVGLGRIGQKVSTLGKAFGMQVAAFDPYVEPDIFKKLGVQPLSLIEVLLSSDVISFHVPLTKETRHMINHQTLEHINPEAVLINTARGELIHETELALQMEMGLLRGAALDVFETEPLPADSRLRLLKNVILTPHLGAYTEQAFEKASQLAVEELLKMTAGKTSDQQLPLSTGWFEKWLQSPPST